LVFIIQSSYSLLHDAIMKIIKALVEKIKDELDDAEEYEDKAELVYLEYPDLTKKFQELARQELAHAMYLHDAAVELIEAKKKSGVVIPQGMLDIWNAEHAVMMKRYKNLKFNLETPTSSK
jgi:F0F1-type ATP synthase membrane subunit b/b'